MTRALASPLCALVLAACDNGSSATQGATRDPSPTEWRQDLATLATELERRHAFLFHTALQDSFLARVRALDESIPVMQRHEVIVALAQLVALVRDGHTELASLQAAARFTRVPLAFYRYGDSLFIAAADSAHRHLLGARIDSIGGLSAAEAFGRVTSILSRDNEEEFKHSGPAHLESPEVLAAFRIAELSDRVNLVLTTTDAGIIRVSLRAIRREVSPRLITLLSQAPGGPPLYASQPERLYWHRHLPDFRTLYAYIGAMANQSGQPSLAKFVQELFATFDREAPERLVLDLRNNSGGNNQLNAPIVAAIRQRPRLQARGALFIVTGRRTFSAAMDLILALRPIANPILVGEPSRGAPFHGGNRESFTLPRSRLVVDYAESMAVDQFRSGAPRLLPVDRAAPPSIVAARAGRDPALEAILRASP